MSARYEGDNPQYSVITDPVDSVQSESEKYY